MLKCLMAKKVQNKILTYSSRLNNIGTRFFFFEKKRHVTLPSRSLPFLLCISFFSSSSAELLIQLVKNVITLQLFVSKLLFLISIVLF